MVMGKISAKVYRINGPVVHVNKAEGLSLMELVNVGEDRLLGEVIEINNDKGIIQVYEDTEGLKPFEPVYGTGKPLAMELGPGLIGNIFDGVGRPLEQLKKQSGDFIGRGILTNTLDREKKWQFTPVKKVGDKVLPGEVIGEIEETRLIKHYCMSPPDISGEIVTICSAGEFSVDEIMAVIDDGSEKTEINFFQSWAVKKPRPVSEKHLSKTPLVTGERVIDTFFPLAKGGTAVIPGGFGTGKTMTQHALAKWSNADVIVYIGCGERGNEITEVLEDFPKLKDPRSGFPLMERTIIIANTSNMPVAAREASIYTGITIAEYYRDMGYHVAIMADSTSRWAEALREISGRLEEMPAEGGFPSYLPSRLADFYERAGYCTSLCGKESSVTVIGAVSPPGGDFSEPVTQNSLRFTRCFWALDKALASARHYPAINWITSYSEYVDQLDGWFDKEVGKKFKDLRRFAVTLLRQENKLEKVVKLVGSASLPEEQKLILETAKLFREGYLQQNAFEKIDMYASMRKQYLMLLAIKTFNEWGSRLVSMQIPVMRMTSLECFKRILHIKEKIGNEDVEKINDIIDLIISEMQELERTYKI